VRIRNPDLLALLHLEHDCCEVTGRTGILHAHHVVYRSQGGDDIRCNLLMIDNGLHARYHLADRNARFQIGTHIRDHRPDILEYVRTKRGSKEAGDAWIQAHL